ncbi:MAG: mechanosensitive ion channel family protein [Anaerolineae bacterium]
MINGSEMRTVAAEIAERIPLVIIVMLLILLARRLVTRVIMRPLLRLLSHGSQPIEATTATLNKVLGAPVNYLLFALMIDATARIYNVQPPLQSPIFNFTRTLVITAVLVLVMRLIDVVTVSRGGLFRFTGLPVEESLIPFARTGIQLVAIVIGLAIVIQVWGYDVSGLIAGLGIGGLAISLAAQDTLSNLFGFTALISDRPFLVGEYIKTPDVEGLVEHVGLRSTRIRQLDQALVAIPNSKLAASPVLNWSRLSKRRIDMVLHIHYATSVDQIESMLAQIREYLAAHEQVEKESIVVYLINLGSQSIEVMVRCYLTIAEWGPFTAAKEIILLRIMRIVENLGIRIALPIQSLSMTPDTQVMFSRKAAAYESGGDRGALPSQDPS